MTPGAGKQHPQRCETCRHFIDDPKQRYCQCGFLDREWIDANDIALISRIGCASHSSAAAPAERERVLAWAKKHHWPTTGGHRVIGYEKLKEFLESLREGGGA